MIAIGNKLVSEELVQEQFVCDLHACKGACCVEGDSGAPLEDRELGILDSSYEQIKPYLTPEGMVALHKAKYIWDAEDKKWKTPLIDGGPCAYITYHQGIAGCGIEQAYRDGKVAFQKPVSCHLYPVRVTSYIGYEAVNYERWHICKAACANGKKLKVPVYQFVKVALIRKYGDDFYQALESYYQQQK